MADHDLDHGLMSWLQGILFNVALPQLPMKGMSNYRYSFLAFSEMTIYGFGFCSVDVWCGSGDFQ